MSDKLGLKESDRRFVAYIASLGFIVGLCCAFAGVVPWWAPLPMGVLSGVFEVFALWSVS